MNNALKNETVSFSALKSEKEPLRILEVIGNASFGGMEKYIAHFLSSLPPNEFQVVCICPYESEFTAALRDRGYRVYITPISDDPVWRSIQFTAELVELHNIDVLHAHMPKAHTLAALAGLIAQKPVVSSVHGMHFSSYELGVTRLTGSHLITNCMEAYGQVIALGIPYQKVSLIHNGVNTGVFTPEGDKQALRTKIGLTADTLLVGYSGRVGYEKGPDTFIRIAHFIHQAMPNVHFAIAGQGDMMEDVKAMCNQSELNDYVHFLGWVDNMPAFYRSLDLLIYPSRSDGSSLALLEAMACGCPAVAMDVGGIRDVVRNRQTGLLASPVRWEDAAVMAKDLLENNDRRKAMGTAAQQIAAREFKLADKMRETANVLKTVAAGRTMKNNSGKIDIDRLDAEQSNLSREAI
jgi:glycosyltransferase involved in cell wall biosynthesis